MQGGRFTNSPPEQRSRYHSAWQNGIIQHGSAAPEISTSRTNFEWEGSFAGSENVLKSDTARLGGRKEVRCTHKS